MRKATVRGAAPCEGQIGRHRSVRARDRPTRMRGAYRTPPTVWPLAVRSLSYRLTLRLRNSRSIRPPPIQIVNRRLPAIIPSAPIARPLAPQTPRLSRSQLNNSHRLAVAVQFDTVAVSGERQEAPKLPLPLLPGQLLI